MIADCCVGGCAFFFPKHAEHHVYCTNGNKKRFNRDGFDEDKLHPRLSRCCIVLLREAENQPRYRDKNLCETKPLVLPSQRSTSKLLPLDPLRATRGPLTRPGHVPHMKVNSLASCALHAKGDVRVHSVVG